jgi:hypothetical protein
MSPQEQKNKTHTRKGRGGRKTFITVFILAICGIAVWFLPPFRVQELEIDEENLRRLTVESIADACSIKKNQSIFLGLGGSLSLLCRGRYGTVEEEIKSQFPTVRSVEVQYFWPGRIALAVEERIEVAWISFSDGCVMIDKEGVALHVQSKPPVGLPVIEGIVVRTMIQGQPLIVDDAQPLNRAISLLGAIIEAERDPRPKVRLLPQIAAIRPIGGRQLYMTLVVPKTGEELTILAECDTDPVESMLWLRFALDQEVLNGWGKGILDLTGTHKTFIPDA